MGRRHANRWARVGLWLASLFLVLACSNDARESTPSESVGRVQVRFWHMWTAEWKVVVDRIVERFNRSQDRYEVVALSVPPTGAEAKFLLAAVGGDPPDVMAQWQNVIPTWADSGLLVSLDQLMSPEDRETFDREAYPITKKIGSYGGNLYGLAVGVNTWAAYVRLDDLREAGLDPDDFPTSLEGLVEWGRHLDRFDDKGNLVRLGFLPQWLMFYAPLFGGGFYDDASGALTLDRPENLRALQYTFEQRQRLGIDRVMRFDSAQNSGFGVEWPFVTGSVSITVDGQWRVEQLTKYAPNLAYRTAPVPPPKGERKLGGYANGNFMIIPSGAREVRGAWEFIRFWSGLADPDVAAELYTAGGWLPSLRSVAEAPAYQAYLERYPQFRTFVDLLGSHDLDTVPPVPFQSYLLNRIEAADQAVARGALTPKAALTRLSQEMDRERDRRRRLGYER